VPPVFLANILPHFFLDPARPEARILPALVVTTLFGLFGYLSRGVTRSGAVAGAAAACLIYVGMGLGGFVTLFAVFAITWLTTRIGYSRKRRLGLAEDRRGRNAGQVLANLTTAALFSLVAIFHRDIGFAAIAALAEAACDTASSEVGEALSSRAWLVTNFRAVQPGINGAISLSGTLAGISAALIVAGFAVAAHVLPSNYFWIVAVAGYLGTIVDSVLGATLEQSHRLNNNAVNFISTFSAALIALAFLSRF
jgi:uncharacterized protein (TIGR00297 family)